LRPSLDAMDRDPAVDAYIGRLVDQEQEVLAAWREACLDLPEPFVEAVRYGMPCYSRDGDPELAFAAQKRHLAFYMMRQDVMEAFRGRLTGYPVGKGCIRFSKKEPCDLPLVVDLIRAVGARRGPIC